MSTSTLQEVLDGLATTIASATGLRAFSYVPEDLNPPALVISLGPMERGAFHMGQLDINVNAALLVSKASDRAGQKQENTFANWGTAQSVWKALDDTPGLGLAAAKTDAKVLRYVPFGIEEVAAYGYFGGIFEIAIVTAGAA